MEDNTTVTMSLARYKELEAFEKAAMALNESKRFLLYYGYQTVYLEGDEITEQLLQDVKRMEERADKIRRVLKDEYPKVYHELSTTLW